MAKAELRAGKPRQSTDPCTNAVLLLCAGGRNVRAESRAAGVADAVFYCTGFGSQALTYAIRGRPHLWSIRPSLWLAGSSLVNVAIACILAIAGIAMVPLPAAVVAATLLAACVFAVAVDLMKRVAFARLAIA
jgi:hypothetical protein